MKFSINTACVGLALVLSAKAEAATQAQIDTAWNKGVAWLMANQHGDGGWSSTVQDGNVDRQRLGLQATGAVIEAFTSYGLKKSYSYAAAVSWIAAAEPAAVDGLARQVLALSIASQDVSSAATRLAGWRNERKGWGTFPQHGSGLPDVALGARALLQAQGAAYTNADLNAALCELLPAQRPNPSFLWPYAIPTVPLAPANQTSAAIIPSVHGILALSQALARSATVACPVSYTLGTVIQNAITGLIAKRNAADGGFGDNGTSMPLETALVLRALKVASPSHSAAPTAIDYLLAQQGTDGSWGGGDPLTTAEVLLALGAPTSTGTQTPSSAVTTDTDGDGIPNGVENQPLMQSMGANSAVANGRFLAQGAGAVVTDAADKMPTFIGLTASPLSGRAGDLFGFTGTVHGGANAAGSVSFLKGGIAQTTVSLTSGAAIYGTSIATAGAHTWIAVYSGDAIHEGSSSAPLTLLLDKAIPSLTLNPTARTVVLINEPALIKLDVGGSLPTGSVTLFNGSTQIGSAGLSGNSVQFTTSFSSQGKRTLTANYSGDANNLPASASVPIDVQTIAQRAAINAIIQMLLLDP